jgi:hypothetical protein
MGTSSSRGENDPTSAPAPTGIHRRVGLPQVRAMGRAPRSRGGSGLPLEAAAWPPLRGHGVQVRGRRVLRQTPAWLRVAPITVQKRRLPPLRLVRRGAQSRLRAGLRPFAVRAVEHRLALPDHHSAAQHRARIARAHVRMHPVRSKGDRNPGSHRRHRLATHGR